ncbi:GFA family protein [Pseudoalteromonas sp. SG45-5]|nr:GFA family protein [Pseudoalteromonas sp. SG45-5]MBB1395964.1 GFA family protein [Pseudoalteromonas sp. SG44-4]MBB1449402.1 GFA family protein [Pseudoalteromonas sp. SG41-6]
MIKGSCCCGAVKFELTEKPSMMGMCHCTRCRKIGASAIAFVKSESFQVTEGLDKITTYKAVEPYKYDRCFCSVCGSALGEVLSESDSFPITANCLDEDVGLENKFHEFISEKPNWLKIGDTAKQFDEHPFE